MGGLVSEQQTFLIRCVAWYRDIDFLSVSTSHKLLRRYTVCVKPAFFPAETSCPNTHASHFHAQGYIVRRLSLFVLTTTTLSIVAPGDIYAQKQIKSNRQVRLIARSHCKPLRRWASKEGVKVEVWLTRRDFRRYVIWYWSHGRIRTKMSLLSILTR